MGENAGQNNSKYGHFSRRVCFVKNLLGMSLLTYINVPPPFQFRFAIISIIFWAFLMFYQIFLSSQVKRRAIISNNHGLYELPHELRTAPDLGSQEIRKYQENPKTLWNDSVVPSLTVKIKILLIKTEIKLFP